MNITLDPLALWLASALLATLFGHAALAKLADLGLFEQHLAAYRVPDGLLGLLKWTVPALELLVALMLLTPWRDAGSALAIALLLAYAGLMGWHRLQGRVLDCGCGGEPLPVSWLLVARNGMLAGVAAAAALPAGGRAMGLADFAIVAAAVPLAALLYAAAHQLLRQTGRGHTPSSTSSGRTSWTH